MFRISLCLERRKKEGKMKKFYVNTYYLTKVIRPTIIKRWFQKIG